MKKKILALALVVAMLAVAIVSASLAYFTDEDYATNAFTVGEVDIDLVENFQNNANMYPGVEINKDAWVENTSTTGNDAYVRVHVAFPIDLAPRKATIVDGKIVGYEYDIEGQDGLAIVKFANGNEKDSEGNDLVYSDYWKWTDTYYAKIGENTDNKKECIVFVATYQEKLTVDDTTTDGVNEGRTVMDAITAVTLNSAVDSDIDGNVLTLFMDINSKNGKFDGEENELSVDAQGTNPFTIEIEVAAEGVQVEGLGTDAEAALDKAFGNPGGYELSDNTDESPMLWENCSTTLPAAAPANVKPSTNP